MTEASVDRKIYAVAGALGSVAVVVSHIMGYTPLALTAHSIDLMTSVAVDAVSLYFLVRKPKALVEPAPTTTA